MPAPLPHSYYSTFPAGVDGLIRQIVEADYPHAVITHVFENAVLYRAGASDPLLSAPYFQSTFRTLEHTRSSPSEGVESAARRFEANLASCPFSRLLEHDRHFRVMFSRDGRPVPAPRAVRDRMERTIQRVSGRPTRYRDADAEVWVSLRREGFALLLFRRLRNRARSTDRPKGMIAPELGALLCRYSDPSPQDVFLDPFCGHGGIFLERMRWKYRLAFAIDRDERLVSALKERLGRDSDVWRKRTYVRSGDGTSLEGFDSGFITAIVTDPPWGEYDRSVGSVEALYSAFLTSAARVLTGGGRLVLLAGRDVAVPEILAPLSSSLEMEASHDMLVSGKKATLYKLRRL